MSDLLIVGKTSEAVFGQGTYSITERLRGTLGLHYTKDTKDYYSEETYFGQGGSAGSEEE